MNILNKTCQHNAPIFGSATNSIPKRTKYSWAKPCDPGTFQMIRKQDLNIDGTYQREHVSEDKVREIAKQWDWRLFGVLSVIIRPDCTFWVYDGGHRCRAAFMRDDIEELPCMVFETTDKIDEARAFLGANLMKSSVSSFHKHRAAVIVGETNAKIVSAILTKYGYTPAHTARKTDFAAISTLSRLVKEDAAMVERVFGACVIISGDNQDPISGDILEGIFRCQKKLEGREDILNDDTISKLSKETIPGIEAAIRREKHIIGKGGDAVAAKAILDLINKGRRKRISFA